MWSAAKRGDVCAVEKLLKEGGDANERGTSTTALHEACARGYVRIVEILLSAGAAVDAGLPEDPTWTPLCSACTRGQAEVVRLLIVAGARLQPSEQVLHDTLNLATVHKQLACAKLLLAAGARISMETMQTAAQMFDSQMLALFLHVGLDPNEHVNGLSLLHLACQVCDYETARMLVMCGADVNAKSGTVTPVSIAFDNRAFETAILVAEAGGTIAHADFASLDEMLQQRLAFAAVNVTVLLVGDESDDSKAARLALAQHKLEGMDKDGFAMFDNRRIRLHLVDVPSSEKLSALQIGADELFVAVVASPLDSVSLLAKTWRQHFTHRGIRCSAVVVGVAGVLPPNEESVMQGRRAAAGQGMRFFPFSLEQDGECSTVINTAIRSALETRFAVGRAFRRTQMFLMALGLHPRLNEQSPLTCIDSFVLQAIAQLVPVPYFFEIRTSSSV